MQHSDNGDRSYGPYYFKHCCGRPYERTPEWLSFFGNIADQTIRRLSPNKVLDVGCAMGFLVEALRDRGVEAFGMDISEYALQKIREDIRPYCWEGSILDPILPGYDLIICIEVLEHLSPESADRGIINLTQGAPDILFSSTPNDYKEATHLNVQPPEYWSELFALHGFFRDVDFEAAFITPWAARFRHRAETTPGIIREYERKCWRLQKENMELRPLSLELQDQLDSKIREQERLLGDLAEAGNSQKSLEVDLAEKDLALNALETALGEKDLALKAMETALGEKDLALQNVQGQLEAIFHSRSWKLIYTIGQIRSRINRLFK
jgi:SAM-dependent methyltransferase